MLCCLVASISLFNELVTKSAKTIAINPVATLIGMKPAQALLIFH